MSKSDANWHQFDMAQARFNIHRQSVGIGNDEPQNDFMEVRACRELGISIHQTKKRGTCFVTKYSKYDMALWDAFEITEKQRKIAALTVIRNEQGFYAYQVDDLKLDFTKQEKSEQHISYLLEQLSNKPRLVLTNQTCFEHLSGSRGANGKKLMKTVVKKGMIVREGDIIFFGRVPMMIKEFQIDEEHVHNSL